jgi:hypothetical protein
MISRIKVSLVLGLGVALLSGLSGIASATGIIPAGWTCNGACGSDGADGVVPLSPLGTSQYQFVTTTGGIFGVGALPTGAVGGETNGSTLATTVFSAKAGDALNFFFDYTTSDGSGFADYAWAELFKSDGTPSALLFTARTEASGSIVPGSGLPAPAATLNPASVPIMANLTTWSPLGQWSGQCFKIGCGTTGWVNSNFIIPVAGNYFLEVGVVNALDDQFDSGLAMDGVTVAGVPITTPEPASLLLMGTGLLSLCGIVRRKFQA